MPTSASHPPSFTCRSWRLPRAGHTAAAYEDALGISPDAAWPVRVAVADGATESAFAGLWARLLVEAFLGGAGPAPGAYAAALPDLRQRWADRVPPTPQPWYLADKIREGAAAALLGLCIFADGTWQALAAGDCCLFHLRHGTTISRWPLDSPDAFHHHPALLRTCPEAPALQHRGGTWAPGDVFLLATDALAAWLMATDPTPWPPLDQTAFEARIEAARADRTLRNDDVTLVSVTLPLTAAATA